MGAINVTMNWVEGKLQPSELSIDGAWRKKFPLSLVEAPGPRVQVGILLSKELLGGNPKGLDGYYVCHPSLYLDMGRC